MGLAEFARIHRESDRQGREKQQQRSERCHCCPASTPQKSEVADRVPDPGSGRLSATHQPTVQLKPLGTGTQLFFNGWCATSRAPLRSARGN